MYPFENWVICKNPLNFVSFVLIEDKKRIIREINYNKMYWSVVEKWRFKMTRKSTINPNGVIYYLIILFQFIFNISIYLFNSPVKTYSRSIGNYESRIFFHDEFDIVQNNLYWLYVEQLYCRLFAFSTENFELSSRRMVQKRCWWCFILVNINFLDFLFRLTRYFLSVSTSSEKHTYITLQEALKKTSMVA